MIKDCPACGRPGAEVFFSLRGVPVHGAAVCETPEQAQALPRGDQLLAVCGGCGFVFNSAFLPNLLDYGGLHAESQSFSPTFRAYAEELASEWVERWSLANTTVIEIGCGGRGDFLRVLTDAGVGRAHGVDPGLCVDMLGDSPRVTGERALFAPSELSRAASAIICRHTLEHVPQPFDFLATTMASVDLQQCRALLFEVPDFDRVLEEGAFWDLHYEHCSNFTAVSLLSLFHSARLDVVNLRRVYRDQYLVIEADPNHRRTHRSELLAIDSVQQLIFCCRAFSQKASGRLLHWRRWLDEQKHRSREVVVWGGGSKGSLFLNALKDSTVKRVVDVNPGLQGRYLAGTGTPILSPAALRSAPPRTVLLMNPIYEDEVRQTLDGLGLGKVDLLTI